MIALLRPSETVAQHVLDSNADAALSYSEVGATRDTMPGGFETDERSVDLGSGEACFASAREALRRWVQFDLGWVEPVRKDVPIEPGAAFGFVARTWGVFTVNVCRVVYVVDGPDRFGFAYGTVGAHVVCGEERFLIERDRESGVVRFSIRKFSRPSRWWYAALGPVTRHTQRRFTADALARVVAEVSP